MTITHDTNARKFWAKGDNCEDMGVIEYTVSENGDIYATHTNVPRQYKGQGIARQLLDALVAFAESKGAKIVPICSYVIATFKKHPDQYNSVKFISPPQGAGK